MNNKRIGIITQARMTSTRLQGKIFLKIKNKKIIEYHINRLAWSNIPIFIATTINIADDLICEFANQHHITYYRGSEENVLSRYFECAKKENLNVIIRVTSDCPLVDGLLIKDAVKEYLKKNDTHLYLSNTINRTFPRGFDFEIFSFDLLKEAYKNAQLPSQKEHVTSYINQNTSGKTNFTHYLYKENASQFRITLDTSEDFTLLKTLIEEYDCDKKNADEIIQLLKINPELAKINQHIEQKKI